MDMSARQSSGHASAVWLSLGLIIGLSVLGYLLNDAILRFKQLDRTVVVKGLSEREVKANIAIWPLRFTQVGNDLSNIYKKLVSDRDKVSDFLRTRGFSDQELSFSSPAVVDKQAHQYGNAGQHRFRYTASMVITVYTDKVARVKTAMAELATLGEQGIIVAGEDYQARTEFLYTELSTIKPEMVEEATLSARKVAEKFAQDSQSSLGKIKRAQQGQFSITNRDSNTADIKKVRVVSTLEYYLID